MPTFLAASFQALDFVVIFVYFVGMAGVGAYFARRPKTTESYFLGGHGMPSWAIGLSMLATSISSVTFLAMPAAAYALDWRMIVPHFWNPVFAALAIWLVIPVFRRTAVSSAYEYLFARFGVGARLYCAIVFLIGQAVRLGAVLYLMVIPIQLITGVSPLMIILVTGGVAAVYTVVGGLAAVIWTDVIQAFVLYLGGLAALLVMLNGIPGGMAEVITVANQHGKWSLGPMEWDPSARTFWTMLAAGIFLSANAYVGDQNVIQRYLSAGSLKEARRATFVCALMSLPTWAFFFFLGTVLYAFYRLVPDSTASTLPADAVFPHFIITRMPAGLSGLVIAGVLSAAMSTLSSSLNSFATVSVTDIIRPYLIKGRSDHFYALTAQGITALAAALMFAISFILYYAKLESALDFVFTVSGLLGGVVLCFFLLGFFAPRVSKKTVWIGFAAGFSLNMYLVLVSMKIVPNILGFAVSDYWVSLLSVTVMLAVSLVLTALNPGNSKQPPKVMP